MLLSRWLRSLANSLNTPKPRRRGRRWNARPVSAIERLEPRAMLSGNVTATLTGATLDLEGDSASNAMTVNQAANGDIVVTGLFGTTINGQHSVVYKAADLQTAEFANLVIHGNDGHDMISVDGVTADGSATIQGNDGNDFITVLGGHFGSLQVDGGNGFNIETVLGGTVAAPTPPTGSGSNSPQPTQVIGNLTVTGGDGFNLINIANVHADGATNVQLGTGLNLVGIMNATVGSTLNVNGGDGVDVVGVVGSHVSGTTTIDLKAGVDFLAALDNTFTGGGTATGGDDLDTFFGRFNSGGLFSPIGFEDLL